MFKGNERSKAVGVPLYYGVVEAVVLAIFCLIAWQMDWTFAPRTENLLKVLAGNYQPLSSQVSSEAMTQALEPQVNDDDDDEYECGGSS